jgi:CheY-like chemotaxis protein
MGAKRALIVDDSRSARLFLARALEQYDLDVDNAESAEAAIEYLSHNHPDVIFMDHLMPGMDGLQAVQVIKSDPRTATIPIMMYTSDEGEPFLGQARALGAMGVLPKQTRPPDVSKVLYQLHLVPERPTREQASFAAAEASPDIALREHFAELRRALVAAVDTQTDRISAEMRGLRAEMSALRADMRALRAEMSALVKSLPPPTAEPAPRRTSSAKWAWLIACAALALALLSGALAWRAQSLLWRAAAQPAARFSSNCTTGSPLVTVTTPSMTAPLATAILRATMSARITAVAPTSSLPSITSLPVMCPAITAATA